MALTSIIEKRRAYRALSGEALSRDLVNDMVSHAGLSASCFNNQPWRFVCVRDPEVLGRTFTALSKGNNWAENAAAIIAVVTRADLDCQIKGRDYFLFDTGMATAFLILRATELNLVAHPIAGFDQDEIRRILFIPQDMTVITLLIIGRHNPAGISHLSEKQRKAETKRPQRMSLEKILFYDRYRDDASPEGRE